MCKRTAVLSALMVFLLLNGARAQITFLWQGDPLLPNGDGTYSNKDHWHVSEGEEGPPTADDNAWFHRGDHYTVNAGGETAYETFWDLGVVTFNGSHTTGSAWIAGASSSILKFLNGGTLTCTQNSTDALVIAGAAGTTGQLLLENGSKVVTTQGSAVVGHRAGTDGWLTLKSGAQAQLTGIAANQVAIVFGVLAQSKGTGFVQGGGSLFKINRGGLELGRAGEARMDVFDSATLMVDVGSAQSAINLGVESGGNGRLVVNGSNSFAQILSGGLEAGRRGAGRVDVIGGAHMVISGQNYRTCLLGGVSGEGILVVDGTGSVMLVKGGRIEAGDQGNGKIYVTGGARLQLNDEDSPFPDIRLGASSTGDGLMSISGTDSQCNSMGEVVVGVGGHGVVYVDQGAFLGSGETLVIASASGSHGEIFLSGAGSVVTTAHGGMVIGDAGIGRMEVDQGGRLSLHGIVESLVLGNAASGEGTLEISGGQLNNDAGLLVVGGSGKGTLIARDGATVSCPNVQIGEEPGSDGTLYLINGAMLEANFVRFGDGSGSLVLQDGSDLETGSIVLGHHDGAVNSIFVDGDGSTFDAQGMMLGGTTGATGQLVVENHGKATLWESLSMGLAGTGNCLIQSKGDLTVFRTLIIYDGTLTLNDGTISGPSLDVSGGGTVLMTNGASGSVRSLTVGSGALVELTGGSYLGVYGLGEPSIPNSIAIHPGGELTCAGTIKARLINEGGTVQLQNAPLPPPTADAALQQSDVAPTPGIQGAYEQTAEGTLRIIITGTTAGEQYAQLIATSVNIQGKIILEFQQGFAPTTGQVFDLVQSPNTTISPNVTVEMRNLAPGFQYDLSVVDGSYRLTAQNDAVSKPVYACTLNHVPGLYLQVDYTGILQSSTDLSIWTDVPGGPGYSFQVPQEDLVGQKFFRVRSF